MAKTVENWLIQPKIGLNKFWNRWKPRFKQLLINFEKFSSHFYFSSIKGPIETMLDVPDTDTNYEYIRVATVSVKMIVRGPKIRWKIIVRFGKFWLNFVKLKVELRFCFTSAEKRKCNKISGWGSRLLRNVVRRGARLMK